MFSIHDEQKLKELLEQNGHKSFRYAQIENAIYKNYITNFDDITTISKDLRDLINQNCFYNSLKIVKNIDSDNGQTTKFLLETSDNKLIEAVIMRHLTGRNTLCVSCQVGCPMGCVFCATGKLGLNRNLEFHEIIDQIMIATLQLEKEGKKLRNVVFMGMGEPFLNYDNVKKAINIACEQKKLDLSNRRITVSTCGIVPGIKKFMIDFPQVSLAISLHAPVDELRLKIMPVNHSYKLEDLMKALDEYVNKTNKKIFYEYIMISGVNDKIDYAYKLAELLKGKLAHVNFIPYNSGEGVDSEGFKPTSNLIIRKFQSVLEKSGIPSTIRHTMGDDINAACGQLALKE